MHGHVVTALLTAAVMDVIGGVANAELRANRLTVRQAMPNQSLDRSAACALFDPGEGTVATVTSGEGGGRASLRLLTKVVGLTWSAVGTVHETTG